MLRIYVELKPGAQADGSLFFLSTNCVAVKRGSDGEDTRKMGFAEPSRAAQPQYALLRRVPTFGLCLSDASEASELEAGKGRLS